jgi:hypothetical protein
MKLRLGFLAFVLAALLGFSPGGGGDPQLYVILDSFVGQNGGTTLVPAVGSPTISIGTRTSQSTALVNGQKTLIIAIAGGDSISANSGPSAYTVLNPTVCHNYDPYGRAMYSYADPVIGASNGPGSMWGILCDRIIANTQGRSTPYARVIVFDTAIGGTTSGDWAPVNGSFGNFSNRSRQICLLMRGLGYPITGSGNGGNWQMVWLYRLGTNDNAPSIQTPSATYTANAKSTFAMLQSYGCTAKIMVSTMTLFNGSTNSSLQTAMAGLVDSVTTFTSDNADTLTGIGTNRAPDGIHFNLTGETNDAALIDAALANAGF